MVDDNHDSTPCQVISKCKLYPHYQMSVLSTTVMKLWPHKCKISVHSADDASPNNDVSL